MAEENIERLNARQFMGLRTVVWKNFFGGMAWGVGSVIGATIVVAIFVLTLRTVRLTPIIGDFVSGVIQVVEDNQYKR